MFVYLSVIFCSFIFSILEVFFNYNKKNKFQIIQKIYIFILFILFVFNRKNSDYLGYMRIFEGKHQIAEKGYMYLNYIINKIFGNYHVLLLILGILLIFTYFYLYKNKYKISIVLLYTTLIFVYDINQIRNLFCILFILIGLKFLIKKKNIVYLFFNFIAISFHRIGYIYLPFFILQKLNLKSYIKMIIFLFAFGFCFKGIFKDMMILLFPQKAEYYFANKPNYGEIFYYFLIFIDVLILKIVRTKKSVYIKYILFPIIFLPYSSLNTELIFRIYRNSFFIKWYYFLKILDRENLKIKFIIWSLLVIQQVIFVSIYFIKNTKIMTELLSQLGNISFYF